MQDRKFLSRFYLLGVLVLCAPTLAAYWLRPELIYRTSLLVLGFVWVLFCAVPAFLFWAMARADTAPYREPRWLADGIGLLAAGLALSCAWATVRMDRGLEFVPLLLLSVAIPCWFFALFNGEQHQRFTRWLLRTRRTAELDADSLKPEAVGPVVQKRALPREIPAAGALVEEGSFAVDAEHALKKLSEFRLADPDAVLLPWLRCAVASGAEAISIDRAPWGLRLVFDGTPLPAGSLKDPTACLFEEESSDRERALYLAYGLLGVLRHKPRLVRIASGYRSKRSLLRMGPLKDTDLETPPEKKETVIEVVLRGWFRRWRARKFLACIEPLLPMTPVALRIDGERFPTISAEKDWRSGSADGVRIHLLWLRPGESGALVNRTRLYKHGVFVCEIKDPVKTPAYLVLVNDDRFALDLSGSQVVQDDRYLWTMERVEALRRKK
ncbi:MAG TPA: hypothetical protein DCM05_07000 [Elusimicrobia bacterium]|nr:hypothetical protein [Elusimicrobiota bacterium]